MRIDGLSDRLNGFEMLFGRKITYNYEDGSQFSLEDALPWDENRCVHRRCGILIRSRQFRTRDASERTIYICQQTARKDVKPTVRDDPVTEPTHATTEGAAPVPRDQFVTRDEMEAVHRRMQQMAIQIEDLQNHVRALNNSQPAGSNDDLVGLELVNGFTNSLRLHIGGKPTRMGFRVSLMKNNTQEIAFQVSVEFSKRIVSRTSFLNGDWGTTERYGGFPFDLNEYFTMVIHRDDSRFYVQVNDQDFCSFDHRFKEVDEINFVRLEGVLIDFQLNVENV